MFMNTQRMDVMRLGRRGFIAGSIARAGRLLSSLHSVNAKC